MAAVEPCTSRAAMSTPIEGASPQARDARMKPASPAWNRRCLPKRSPSRPPSTSTAAYATPANPRVSPPANGPDVHA